MATIETMRPHEVLVRTDDEQGPASTPVMFVWGEHVWVVRRVVDRLPIASRPVEPTVVWRVEASAGRDGDSAVVELARVGTGGPAQQGWTLRVVGA